MQKDKSIANIIKSMADPIAQQLGLEIWDLKFLKEGPNWFLRVFIDKESGVTLDDCEKMSKALDRPLDELDPIEESYCLEVCSPGIERELTKDVHLQRYLGANIKAKLIKPIDSKQKIIEGQLIKFDRETIFIKTDLDQTI